MAAGLAFLFLFLGLAAYFVDGNLLLFDGNDK